VRDEETKCETDELPRVFSRVYQRRGVVEARVSRDSATRVRVQL
jgi:hypothetical protein